MRLGWVVVGCIATMMLVSVGSTLFAQTPEVAGCENSVGDPAAASLRKICLTERDAEAFGSAIGAVQAGLEACGGRISMEADQIAALFDTHLVEKFFHVQREAYTANIARYKTSKGTQASTEFCRRIDGDYGPKGRIWARLYQPSSD